MFPEKNVTQIQTSTWAASDGNQCSVKYCALVVVSAVGALSAVSEPCYGNLRSDRLAFVAGEVCMPEFYRLVPNNLTLAGCAESGMLIPDQAVFTDETESQRKSV